MKGERIYILDTNVLIHDPQSIFSFAGASVGIPIIVLEELDKFKGENTDRGAATRMVIRYLDALRARGSLKDGVPLDNGGKLEVLFLPEKKLLTMTPLKLDVADNEILQTALCLKDKGYDVQFISKDLNARVKADVLGIHAQDYLKEHISKDDFYKGWVRIKIPAVQLKKDFPDELIELSQEHELLPNEFVLAESQHNPFNYKVFRYLGKQQFKTVSSPKLKWPLDPRNPQQLMSMDLLFDDEVKLVSLIGSAGTGKTILSLLAGLQQVLINDEYYKILISRPVIPLGADIGYLPGTIEEKLHSWMQPIYDNMEFILHAANIKRHLAVTKEEVYAGKRGRKTRAKQKHKKERVLESLDELIRQGNISLEAITYMRGRSIPFQFIIIDEVQNLTPHEVKTLISRVGEGSKIVLTGDPFQIDSPYLDFQSNGLVVASNKFKGQPLFGTVYLETSERSELSKLANELM